jgi:ABC-type branched-subunit amino acid transport system substrate-binding protein
VKKLGIIALVVLCSLGLSAPAGAQDVKVGTLMSITGPLKEYGPAIQKGIDLAAKQMAAAGLKIKVIPEDDETSAIPGTNAARKLVEVDKVAAIIGALASGVTQPVAESVTCPAGVILISPASTSPLLTQLPADKGKDVLFRTCPSDSLQGTVSGAVAAKLYKTISVLYVNNAYGQGLAEWFKKSYEEKGGKVLAMVPHDEKAASSYTAELKKALAGKPQALAAFSYPEHAKVYVKEAIEFFKFKNFYFCDGTKSEVIIQAVGAANLEGLMGTAPGSTGGKALQAFNDAFKKEYGSLPPLPFITNGYDAMAVIGLAAYKVKVKGLPMTSTNIRDQLRFVANPPGTVILPGEFKKAFDLIKKGEDINYEGAAGAQDFDANGDVITPIEVWKFTGGKIVTVRME